MVEANVIINQALVTQANGDYEKLCLNVKQIMLGLKYKRDEDEHLFKALLF